MEIVFWSLCSIYLQNNFSLFWHMLYLYFFCICWNVTNATCFCFCFYLVCFFSVFKQTVNRISLMPLILQVGDIDSEAPLPKRLRRSSSDTLQDMVSGEELGIHGSAASSTSSVQVVFLCTCVRVLYTQLEDLTLGFERVDLALLYH